MGIDDFSNSLFSINNSTDPISFFKVALSVSVYLLSLKSVACEKTSFFLLLQLLLVSESI